MTTEKRQRTNANLVLQYAPNDNLIITADALYSDFDVRNQIPPLMVIGLLLIMSKMLLLMLTVLVTEMYQQVGLATDFHAKKADRLTDSLSVGLNFRLGC